MVKIEDACRNLRKKLKDDSKYPHVFTVNISMHDRLDEEFKIPQLVREVSLFPKWYPDYKLSTYLRKNYKFFQAFQGRYQSCPTISYGGLVEWIYVTTGSIEMKLYRPTKTNLVRYYALEEGEDLRPEADTCLQFELKQGSLFSIPSGWISVRSTKNKSAFTYGGKILGLDDIPSQLEAFENDVLHSNCQHMLDIDAEIRSLYWFSAINMVKAINNKSNKIPGDKIISILECLRKYLVDWRSKQRKCHADRVACLPPEVFAPDGIRIDTVLRDVGGLIRRRKSFQGEKDAVDVSVTQTSTDGNSN